MQSINTSILALISLVVPTLLASLLPSVSDHSSSNKNVMRARGTIGGIEVNYNGTVQEVLEQFHRDHPDIKLDSDAVPTSSVGGLTRREENPNCLCRYEHPLSKVSNDDVSIALAGLDRAKYMTCENHPGACTRISCQNSAAVYICADINFNFLCGEYLQYAQAIQGKCNGGQGKKPFCGTADVTTNLGRYQIALINMECGTRSQMDVPNKHIPFVN